MKNYLALAFCLFLTLSMSAKSLDNIMSKYAKVPNADNVNIGRIAWNFIKLSCIGNKGEGLDIVKKINSLHIIDLENCSIEIKQEFENDFKDFSYKGYDLLMKVKDDEDDVVILSKNKKDHIKEFILISIKDDPTIIKIKGNFKTSDLSDIQGKYGPKNKKTEDKKQ